jgi:NAD(P)-dependent dehydrogenase (short-subunit alcohol dehydrogenase family)
MRALQRSAAPLAAGAWMLLVRAGTDQEGDQTVTVAKDPLALFRLDSQVALVTGASSGLGARFAGVLAAAGASVAVVARRAEKLNAVAAEIGAAAIVADVTVEEDVERIAAETLDRFGQIDVLVNNAGASDHGPAEREPLERFRRIVDVNLVAAYHLSQVVGRHMLDRGQGSIINVASVLGLVSAGQIPQPGYAASKAGLINLSRELGAQWGRRGIRVNALCPGWFESELTADMFADERALTWIRRKTILGRPGREHELDGALLWLAGDASSYVTGQTIVVDGGYVAM